MSVQNENASSTGETVVLDRPDAGGVYASLFEKINLKPASHLSDINTWQDEAAMAEADTNERITAGVQVFLERLRQSGQKVEKLDKTLIDHHIAELDHQISRQLDAVMHHEEFQKVESLWRGLKHLVDNTDYRQNVRTEILDVSKDDLRQDFEDAPELIQSGLYWHSYTSEYDTPGGEPIAAVISAYEFDASPQDVALMRNISKVSAAAHMPFIGSAGPKFFLKSSMEEVAAIKDIGNYFDRAEYIKWKSFRDTDDSRYLGLVMPRVLGRLPYGPDTVSVWPGACVFSFLPLPCWRLLSITSDLRIASVIIWHCTTISAARRLPRNCRCNSDCAQTVVYSTTGCAGVNLCVTGWACIRGCVSSLRWKRPSVTGVRLLSPAR